MLAATKQNLFVSHVFSTRWEVDFNNYTLNLQFQKLLLYFHSHLQWTFSTCHLQNVWIRSEWTSLVCCNSNLWLYLYVLQIYYIWVKLDDSTRRIQYICKKIYAYTILLYQRLYYINQHLSFNKSEIFFMTNSAYLFLFSSNQSS